MAHDTYHHAVRHALERAGWTITSDPLVIFFEGHDLYIDLGAEKLLAAEKDGQRIAVEIKSFVGTSAVYDYHAALGQYLNYRLALESSDPQRRLVLAVPKDAFDTFLSQPFAQASIRRFGISLLVFNPLSETVLEWIS